MRRGRRKGRKKGETLWTGPNKWASAAGSGDQRQTARSYLGLGTGRKGRGIANGEAVVELIDHLRIVGGTLPPGVVGRFCHGHGRMMGVIG